MQLDPLSLGEEVQVWRLLLLEQLPSNLDGFKQRAGYYYVVNHEAAIHLSLLRFTALLHAQTVCRYRSMPLA